jgi:hypothetical protein
MMTSKNKKTRAVAARDDALAVYDGQTFLGSILEMGAAFVAYDAAGVRLSVFKTLAEASRAIPRVTS